MISKSRQVTVHHWGHFPVEYNSNKPSCADTSLEGGCTLWHFTCLDKLGHRGALLPCVLKKLINKPLKVIFGTIMYHIELDSNLKFNSIPMGMWWASLTMTRVTKFWIAEINLILEFVTSKISWSRVLRILPEDLETLVQVQLQVDPTPLK